MDRLQQALFDGLRRWDTGATLANFALFDLVGLQLSPQIRDLGKITLYRTGPRAGFAARYPSAGPLLTRRLNSGLISRHVG